MALAPTLPGWVGVIDAVYPGPVPTDAPPMNYATVGYTGAGESGSYTQEQNSSGYETNETGVLHCEVNCSVGDDDPLISESVVFAALDGLQAAIVADRQLGVLPAQSRLGMAVTLAPVMNEQGTGYVARFALNYFTVT
ncbi:MAG TPA: hypothetical protein VE441_04600 [Mycobacterium sp.]|nr:hypothetical protein [Mycobacterium sp.]